MQHSNEIKQIAQALNKAQVEIRAAIKDATNPHFRSKYADLASVIEAVKGPLNANGITFLQGVSEAGAGVAVETRLLHTSGEWIASTLMIPASKQDAQGFGSAITYGRRYGLQAMCGVPAEDDDGNAASRSAIGGAMAALSRDDQDEARIAAAEIVKLWNEDKTFAAYERFYEQDYTNELKLGIWECLQPHSKIRSGLKKISDENKKANKTQ